MAETQKIYSTDAWHRFEKEPTMCGELSASYLLRGPEDSGNSELIIGDGAYPDGLGRAVARMHKESGIQAPIVNIGDGLGLNGPGIQRALPKCRLLSLDLSPKLILEQRGKDKNRPITQADATRLPFAHNTLAGVVANEIIADFPVYEFENGVLALAFDYVDHHNIEPANRISFSYTELQQIQEMLQVEFIKEDETSQFWTELIRVYTKYRLDLPDRSSRHSAINIGTIWFLEELNRVLKPGGWAWISEFEDPRDPDRPVVTELEGHNEYSIAFSVLEQVSKVLGFDVSIVPLVDEIGVDMNALFVDHNLGNGDGVYLSPNEAVTYYPDQYNWVTSVFDNITSNKHLPQFQTLKLTKQIPRPEAIR